MPDPTDTMHKPLLCIVTPALADANNGNWQTARRWAQLLSGHYRVRLDKAWRGDSTQDLQTDVLLALHARRSADSVAAWAAARPGQALVVALTGTDLYRDIAVDATAQRSLALADRLIVLQDQAPHDVPARWRVKCRVVFQSSTRRRRLNKTTRHLRAVVVGHLREEKSPQTIFETARLLSPDEGIFIDHLGQALDPALGEAARATQAGCPHYRWLGGVSHAVARERIQRAHLLLHPSRMEGGAHVIIEAVQSGTPVLASRIPGNVGMLGADYGGYFPGADAARLAALLRTCRADIGQPAGTLERLHAQCEARAPWFDRASEQRHLLQALAGLRGSVPL
jgi:putative glycosyltransferase (TIGR04348 family)